MAGQAGRHIRHTKTGLLCAGLALFAGSGWFAGARMIALVHPPYMRVAMHGPAAPVARQAEAAVAAVPGSVLIAYEVPVAPDAAVRITVAKGGVATRVSLHPATLAVLDKVREEGGPVLAGALCGTPDYAPLERLVKAVAPLRLQGPVSIVAPPRPDRAWAVRAAGRVVPIESLHHQII